MSYRHHRDLLDQELENYIAQKKELEQSLRNLKEAHRERVISIVTCHHNNPDVVDMLASYSYVFDGNMDSSSLSSVLSSFNGKNTHTMAKHIKTFGLQKPCDNCGKTFEFTINSRSSNVKYDRHGRPTEIGSWSKRRCDECESAERQKYDEQQKVNAEKAKQYYVELESLKTMPYDEYLQTDHWQQTRKRALGRAKYKCELCNKTGELHVHHKTYARRGNEWNADLIALCAHCHAKFHDKLKNEEVMS